ncbi:MAG TPA: hypothetical protein VG982_00535 [Candidatus Paceibacterota bacterium]|jgi:hypothetical protein|nr:hypothetical protein [Candidatus Paceibacterota bacterium]
MSTFLKILLVIVIVGGIILAVRSHKQNSVSGTQTENSSPATTQPLSNGDSDADLQNDLNSIDTSLNAVDQSSADVDAGLNDQPIPQQ